MNYPPCGSIYRVCVCVCVCVCVRVFACVCVHARIFSDLNASKHVTETPAKTCLKIPTSFNGSLRGHS